jgi:ABC-type oligopeptide transport system substrate-binding subunit
MTIWARDRFGSAMLALTLALVTWPVMAQAQQKVLRVVPQGEVKVFDPHQSQVNLTSMHAALVYDTLFSWDVDMAVRPQMVERWTLSDDKLLYTFTLRPGLIGARKVVAQHDFCVEGFRHRLEPTDQINCGAIRRARMRSSTAAR